MRAHLFDRQVFEDPQVQASGPAATVDSPHVGELTLLGQPMPLSRTPCTMARFHPRSASTPREFLRELGFAPDEIAELNRQRII